MLKCDTKSPSGGFFICAFSSLIVYIINNEVENIKNLSSLIIRPQDQFCII